MTPSDYVLSLVRQALDEFDDRPLEVSVRRAVRIASLVGNSRTAYGSVMSCVLSVATAGQTLPTSSG